jgi:hypothetical protein
MLSMRSAQVGMFDAVVLARPLPEGSFVALLAEHGERIVRDEDFAECYSTRMGRPHPEHCQRPTGEQATSSTEPPPERDTNIGTLHHICRAFPKWRDPDSNRGHHDFEACCSCA